MSALSLVVVAIAASTPLTLQEVREASHQQLDALKAELSVEGAQSGIKTAWSSIMPQISLNAGVGIGAQLQYRQINQYTGAEQISNFVAPNFRLGLQVSQLLYDGGRWWTQISQAGAQKEAADGQLKEQQMASELEATRRFYTLLKAQLALKVLEETVRRSTQQLESARSLYEAGRGQRSAVYDAATNLGNDEITVVRQKQSIVAARLALLQWLGRPDSDIEAVTPSEMDQGTQTIDAEASINFARDHRPLLKALDAQVRAAEFAITNARADYFPQLSVSAGYSRNANQPLDFVDLRVQHGLSASLNLQWNIFNGLSTQAAEEKSKQSLKQTQLQQKQSIVDLEVEIRQGAASLETEQQVLTIAQRNLSQAEQQAALETERFAAGAGSSLEVRNAVIKYTQAQLAVLQGRADVATARAALNRSIGGAP